MKKDCIILVAENDERHFEMIKNCLLRAGVSNEILRFPDGRQTLDYLFKRNPDSATEQDGREYILFMDVNLPEVSGVEVLEKIKKDEQLSKIPVIVLTAADDPDIVDRCYDLGCTTYVVKPAGSANFQECIQNIGSLLSVVETTPIM
ncbi:MAG: response regulator [Planctomycetota bacterium]|jgi:CheY-like chemotaxis protein